MSFHRPLHFLPRRNSPEVSPAQTLIVTQRFDTIVVAKLPFIPFGFFTALSHRNIAGTDLTDCSYVFLYAMSSMALKANLTKALGFTTPTPPAGQNPFFDMPDPDDDRAWGR